MMECRQFDLIKIRKTCTLAANLYKSLSNLEVYEKGHNRPSLTVIKFVALREIG